MPRWRDGAPMSARIVDGDQYARVGRGCEVFCAPRAALAAGAGRSA